MSRRIIDGVKDKARVGVCLDTCHLFAAGHDVATSRAAYDAVMEVGLLFSPVISGLT